jgi:hypothetical protein
LQQFGIERSVVPPSGSDSAQGSWHKEGLTNFPLKSNRNAFRFIFVDYDFKIYKNEAESIPIESERAYLFLKVSTVNSVKRP